MNLLGLLFLLSSAFSQDFRTSIPPDDSVGSSQLQDGSVTPPKLVLASTYTMGGLVVNGEGKMTGQLTISGSSITVSQIRDLGDITIGGAVEIDT